MISGGKQLVPLSMIMAAIAFAVAAMTSGFIVDRPAWWQAVVPLAVLGGITPMIYAVNIRVVPVFARRQWQRMHLLRVHTIAMIVAAWLIFVGHLEQISALITLGSFAALASGLLFMYNTTTLFRQPAGKSYLPATDANQKEIDRIASMFTRASAMFLLIGLGVGVARRFWQPDQGRWELVWAHAMLIGFMLSMACGICYHVMSRWTGRPWQSVRLARIHLLGTLVGLPLMLIALAFDINWLFLIAGPLQALAIAVFLVAIAPFVIKLPGTTRFGMTAAAIFLLVGISLGAWFAIDPAMGARLRLTHAGINLFGFTGLLISGVGYYFIPRFAGHPLRWPRLAWIQIALLGGGVAAGAVALAFRSWGHTYDSLIVAAYAMVAVSFSVFALMIAGAFFGHASRAIVTPVRIQPTSRARDRSAAS